MAKSLVVGVAEIDPFFEDGNFNVGCNRRAERTFGSSITGRIIPLRPASEFA